MKWLLSTVHVMSRQTNNICRTRRTKHLWEFTVDRPDKSIALVCMWIRGGCSRGILVQDGGSIPTQGQWLTFILWHHGVCRGRCWRPFQSCKNIRSSSRISRYLKQTLCQKAKIESVSEYHSQHGQTFIPPHSIRPRVF